MFFYLTLSSDGCNETYSGNHSGDFTIELNQTLDMRSQPWEVALVDMIYTGQAFPNVSNKDSLITLNVLGKPKFHNDYIITYEQTFNLWLSFKSWIDGKEYFKPKVYLTKKHYSWLTFIEEIKYIC